jgi:hypothetical protein
VIEPRRLRLPPGYQIEPVNPYSASPTAWELTSPNGAIVQRYDNRIHDNARIEREAWKHHETGSIR